MIDEETVHVNPAHISTAAGSKLVSYEICDDALCTIFSLAKDFERNATSRLSIINIPVVRSSDPS